MKAARSGQKISAVRRFLASEMIYDKYMRIMIFIRPAIVYSVDNTSR